MFCPSCGKELKEGSRFCGFCGVKVEVAPQAPAAPEATQPAASEAPQPSPADDAAATRVIEQPATPVEPAPAPADPAPQPTPQPASAAPTFQQQRGVLGTAWHDITSSPRWIKRTLLLMAMKCVPVLGIYTSGYSLEWGAAAARGDASPLPIGSFRTRTFLLGLFASIINFCFATAGTVLWILNLIPFLGWIALFVLNLFIGAFCSLTIVRMGLFDSFAQAGELSEIWRVYKGGFGSLIAAACLPGIIVTAAFIVAVVLLLGLMMVSAYAGSGYYGSFGGYGMGGFLGSIFAVFGSGIILLVLLYIFFSGLTEMWSLRAVGHWIARNVPEWPAAAKAAQATKAQARPVAAPQGR